MSNLRDCIRSEIESGNLNDVFTVSQVINLSRVGEEHCVVGGVRYVALARLHYVLKVRVERAVGLPEYEEKILREEFGLVVWIQEACRDLVRFLRGRHAGNVIVIA